MKKYSVALLAVTIGSATVLSSQDRDAQRKFIIDRAQSLELDTPYAPPPGDALEHHTAGFAKIMCSAVFITGLDPDFAAENVGYFISPYAERAKVGKPVVDRAAKAVHITLPNGTRRTARYRGRSGVRRAAIRHVGGEFHAGSRSARHPAESVGALARGRRAGWRGPAWRRCRQVEAGARRRVHARRRAHRGAGDCLARTADRRAYGPGITAQTPLESWSMTKSLTSTLMGMLIRRGDYELWQPAPIPEWQTPGDPRARIRIGDILQMSSGLRIRAPQIPATTRQGPIPIICISTRDRDAHRYAATRPQQWPPATVGRYRNTDPVLISYLIRLAVEKRGEPYLTFPQRALFDKLGIRTMVFETDAQGHFLGQGLVLGSARDWARLGQLYLRDGVWNGERMLPDGYVSS